LWAVLTGEFKLVLRLLCLKTCGGSWVWQYNRVFLMGEIGTDENLAIKRGAIDWGSTV